ncbi:YolD-like family protein [Paenibacillus macquariensis]|uniref:YolD-like protein n=1 Tax=Paenibacillus macquariensis TaxID=948756 RepID=A0ABY1KEU3_9BACL|nr:YolD-like family protein [Paenibacillus macquariensis]OAB29590.1 hypothetical protein PMSM_23690 [Paenibacillus macquariensis subsp. macquariensis]SIR73082.1 YolD-like protein [Paenibacillus macquariensis]
MIHDRGHKKWTSLMIPEHTAMLQQWVAEQEDIRQPVLDEDRLEELNTLLMHSWSDQRSIQVHYYNNKRFHDIRGCIRSIDPHTHTLTLLDLAGDKTCISLYDIQDLIPY